MGQSHHRLTIFPWGKKHNPFLYRQGTSIGTMSSTLKLDDMVVWYSYGDIYGDGFYMFFMVSDFIKMDFGDSYEHPMVFWVLDLQSSDMYHILVCISDGI